MSDDEYSADEGFAGDADADDDFEPSDSNSGAVELQLDGKYSDDTFGTHSDAAEGPGRGSSNQEEDEVSSAQAAAQPLSAAISFDDLGSPGDGRSITGLTESEDDTAADSYAEDDFAEDSKAFEILSQTNRLPKPEPAQPAVTTSVAVAVAPAAAEETAVTPVAAKPAAKPATEQAASVEAPTAVLVAPPAAATPTPAAAELAAAAVIPAAAAQTRTQQQQQEQPEPVTKRNSDVAQPVAAAAAAVAQAAALAAENSRLKAELAAAASVTRQAETAVQTLAATLGPAAEGKPLLELILLAEARARSTAAGAAAAATAAAESAAASAAAAAEGAAARAAARIATLEGSLAAARSRADSLEGGAAVCGDDVAVLKSKALQLVGGVRTEKGKRLRAQREAEQQEARVAALSAHIEKLMSYLRHEAAAKARAHDQQARLQKEVSNSGSYSSLVIAVLRS
jgi:trimeric autotransporter adhesin